MTGNGWLQILLYCAAILAVTKPLGVYMFRVFEGDRQPLPRLFGPIERFLYRPAASTRPASRTGRSTRLALLLFSAFGVLVTYVIQRFQAVSAAQPAGARGGERRLARSTPPRASPPTPTGRATAARSTMSYLTQMAGLAWHNFTSAAAGIGVALAMARGLTRRARAGVREGSATSGSIWSAARSTCCCRSASSFALVLVSQGVIQNLSAYRRRRRRSRAASRPWRWARSPRRMPSSSSAPTAAGSSTPTARIPFENPTPLSNFVADVLDLRASPPGSPTRTAAWRAISARAGRSSPRWRCSFAGRRR